MSGSFQQMKRVPSALLQERLETVKDLSDDGMEMYEIAKDRETGEHYLHYSYLHKDIAQGGAEEIFHQLQPLESDDVLGIMFSGQPYDYPDSWAKPFLRNGPDGDFVWFDPGNPNDEQSSLELGQQLSELLMRFKQGGELDPEQVRMLLNETDKLRKDDNESGNK
ncbi:hypothetical protein [Paenibacillus thalictri]|uniref:Uncharacterized protein n=1 Tax=Paenibacillus thalictri TaxID=2527873 RepID=A0A4Q9DWY6_9BACL|nr:hypothetical protein [Paenibacillus thalictri]TBL80267.1 hypothetical protein EYB31_07565 [Paenibacillus thalictri]